MKYYSAIKRNKSRSFVVMWMDLELVIQSKASQKERESKCHILTQIYMESRKRVQINLFAGRNREGTCGHRGGREGWDELGG